MNLLYVFIVFIFISVISFEKSNCHSTFIFKDFDENNATHVTPENNTDTDSQHVKELKRQFEKKIWMLCFGYILSISLCVLTALVCGMYCKWRDTLPARITQKMKDYDDKKHKVLISSKQKCNASDLLIE